MKQAGYICGLIFFLVLGFFIGREFLEFQAIGQAKLEARECYLAGVDYKIKPKQADGFWKRDYKLPAGFSYADEFPDETEVRLDDYTNAVLFYVKPIFSLPKWIVVYGNGSITEHEGDISELIKK